jgi:hypothetical protein
MYWSRTAMGLGGALALVAGLATAAPPASGESAVEADYQMNEAPGATVMTDSSGNGLNGAIDPTGVASGYEYGGAVGYNWVRRNPNEPPASPERVIQVPDDSRLDPGDDVFSVEIRFRTKENFGNIIQKGQARAKGGQWKIQNPQGRPSCLFKGSIGRSATRVKTPINDNEWHVLKCVRTMDGVYAYVDGVLNNRKRGYTGTIDNAVQMTIGGKINCDQIKITCDYFSGQIDYVQITRE